MESKLFDIYGIIGLLVSIIAILFSFYKPPQEILWMYVVSIILVSSLLGLVIVLLNKFSEIKNNQDKIEDLSKRFKTLEDLNNIKLDIRELQRKVLKNG